ncbi:MAG TPA: hypothetical protein VJU61_25945 [Polyangiaceae bacterium]|nr:hypothetical protein [Polyangiaceae bacterium]
MYKAGRSSASPWVQRVASAGPSVETDDDDPPGGSADHGDLLDADWLQRAEEDIASEDDVVDVALTLDLDAGDDADELAHVLDLDVGPLLTSLLPSASPSETVDTTLEPPAREPNDTAFGLGALREHLLPEGSADPARTGGAQGEEGERGDEEVGADERFPVFEEVLVVLPPAPSTEEANDD